MFLLCMFNYRPEGSKKINTKIHPANETQH